jgi:hypothetical protein
MEHYVYMANISGYTTANDVIPRSAATRDLARLQGLRFLACGSE